jgi:hypothetical protein
MKNTESMDAYVTTETLNKLREGRDDIVDVIDKFIRMEITGIETQKRINVALTRYNNLHNQLSIASKDNQELLRVVSERYGLLGRERVIKEKV